jgi:hypothetical protein
MSLLFDQNLSRRLVGLLAAEYPGSEHVAGAGLMGADDLTVWKYYPGRQVPHVGRLSGKPSYVWIFLAGVIVVSV